VAREFALLVFDDHANEYRDEFLLQAWAKTGGWAERGTPTSVESLPVGFTWIGKVCVRMPPAAPIVRVELERTSGGRMFDRPKTDRFPMSAANPTAPEFEFKIPSQLLLSEGTNFEAGRDIRAVIGHLAVHDSFKTGSFGPSRTESGLSLLLPVEVTDLDYCFVKARISGLA
jgi:hypothetical protein